MNAPLPPPPLSTGPDRPPWWIYLLLPLLHFASVKLTLFCAVTPEIEVVVWLPNAVLLAALLRYQGQRGWAMAALTYSSDVLATTSAFPLWSSVLLGLVNLAEVLLAYGLMRRMQVSQGLQRFEDFGKFIAAGPIVAALLAALLASAVLLHLDASITTPYLTLVRVWWFGDALGLLIYTPLLLSFSGPVRSAPTRFTLLDGTIVLLGLALAGLVFTAKGGQVGGVSVTPDLLLPPVLYLAVRFGVRWTALAVALISLTTAWVLTTGHQPFGAVDVHLEIVRAQEFIFTLCSVGIGFAILLTELKTHERGLEDKVRERTQALEASNARLASLSATDGLTGIANRRRFDEVLASEWNRAARSGQPLALVMLDMDFFKAYNDHYGHLAGDDCLRHIAHVLGTHLHRSGDLVARYGGEEFVLLASVRDSADALHIAETARLALAALALPHAASSFGVVTASLGVAVHVPAGGEAADLLVQQADQALYRAKARGRNQTVLQTACTV